MLTPPPNAKIKEWSTSTCWFDEYGILYSISRKAPNPTLEESQKLLEEFRDFAGNKKVCMLVDVTQTAESTREMREYAAQELPKIVKAIAMVSDSALGTMLANLFFTLKTQPYPTKMFKSESEAREWLIQYL